MRKKIRVNDLRKLVKSIIKENIQTDVKAQLAAEEIFKTLKSKIDYHGENMLEEFINDILDNHDDSVSSALPYWDAHLDHLDFWPEMFNEDGIASRFAFDVSAKLAQKLNFVTPREYRNITA